MTITGTARRVTSDVGRRAFEAGAIILVSTSGLEELPVTARTVTHHRQSTTWADLAEMMTMWANRYPGQAYYVVERAS